MSSLILNPYSYAAEEGVTPVNPTTTGMQSYWSMDNTASAEHGSYDLTAVSVTYTNVDPAVGTYSGNFDGANDQFRNTGYPTTYHQSDYSICTHVWQNVHETCGILGQWEGVTAENHLALTFDSSANAFKFTMQNSAGTSFVVQSDSYTGTAEWKQVIMVRSGDDLSMYVDGVLQADTETFSGTENTSTAKIRLGCLDSSLFLDGKMEQTSVWTKALTEGNALWMYNDGSFRQYADY